MALIEILQPGLLTTIQDRGRRGVESFGMPRSGAFDPFLANIANKLVGNSSEAALLEFALTGPTLLFHESCHCAIVGFDVRYKLNTADITGFCAVQVQSGSSFHFQSMKGWYGYIAVEGGFQTNRILNSASTYLAGGIGTRLKKGETLVRGPNTNRYFALRSDYWKFADDRVIQLLPALHKSHFKEREQITGIDYQIDLQSNRMGIRLTGSPIEAPTVRRSAPVLPGTVQIPPSGLPIILGPEGPTTGGYPQLGIVSRTSWTILAQTPPGNRIRFDWAEAHVAREGWNRRQTLFEQEEPWEPV
jgi:biotin-dependent carboxylase-like uncharacterized protein